MKRATLLTVLVAASGCVTGGGAFSNPRLDGGGNADPWGDANPGGNSGEFNHGSDMNCGGQLFASTRLPPNVMLVLDRSGSMHDPISERDPNGPSKWDDLKVAINLMVTQFDSHIRFGADLFSQPGTNRCVPGPIAVPIGDGNGGKVLAAIAATSPAGETPTAATLDVVIRNGMLSDPTRDNFVVLATDGLPNCNDTNVAARISTLYHRTPQVKTYVIGVGDETAANPATLDAWAVAGHTDLPGPTKYYQASSPQDLQSAFTAIAGGVVSCTLLMEKAPPDPTQLYVWIDKTMVPADATNGWTYDSKGPSVTLHGAACNQIKASPAAKVQLIYGCPEAPIL